jgi:branched-chain amino acid transport system substrate-binding protein
MKLKVTLVAAPILALIFAAVAVAKTDNDAAASAAKAATITCGSTRTIGMAAPITGPAASIGSDQVDWAQFFVSNWNKLKVNKNRKIKLIQGDTQLGVNTSFAVSVAQSFASNSKLLAVVGPAGSQEVVASTSAYQSGGLGFISGSATRVSLTDGVTDGNRIGSFYRTVPNDGIQAPTVANYIAKKLNATRVYIIDDQEVYSQGLADGVQALLKAKGVTVTRDSISQQASDFSSNIAKIPGNTQVVYTPWQLSPQAQTFGQQLKAAGKGGITMFGSDGLFDPATWKITGSYVSFFPVNTSFAVVKAFQNAHGGNGEYFGAPSYVAAQVATLAVTRACADGKATRAEVRAKMAKINIPAKLSLLGIRIDFQRNGNLRHGGFGVYQIQSDGTYKRVG